MTRQSAGERGAGLVGTIVGFTMFMVLLLLALQVTVHLYATSAITAAAFNAADTVATSTGSRTAAAALAESRARRELGDLGGTQTAFHWQELNSHRVVLEVVCQSPHFLPLPTSFDRIKRVVSVRTERFRPSA